MSQPPEHVQARAAAWPVETLVLILTTACNLRCTYCYQRRSAARKMSWRTIESALEWLRSSHAESPRLVISGGEPTLVLPTVRRVIVHARSVFRNDGPLQIELLTNGTCLKERSLAFLARHRVGVQVSFDGLEEAQRLRGEGTFEYVDALLRRMAGRFPSLFDDRLSVAVTLTPDTVNTLAASVRHLMDLDVREILISPALGGVPRWHEIRLGDLDAQFEEIYSISLRYYRQTGRVPVAVFRKGGRTTSCASDPWCGAIRGVKMVVDVDGAVCGCSPMAPSMRSGSAELFRRVAAAMAVGTVHMPALASSRAQYQAALQRTGLFDRRDTHSSACGACRTCRHLRQCMVCPLHIAAIEGSSDAHRVPDFVCAFNQAALKFRSRFPRQGVSSWIDIVDRSLVRPALGSKRSRLQHSASEEVLHAAQTRP